MMIACENKCYIVVSMTLDLQLLYLLNGLAGQSPFLDGVIVFLASYLAYLVAAVFLAFVLFSSYARREKLELLLVAGISTFVARFGVTELIRFFYHRPRPFMTLLVHRVFDPVTGQLLADNAWSFPSGHATFFFALATAVYLYNKKWGTGFFIAAIAITLGRVAAGVHYPSDIVGGALIGGVVAYGTFYFARKIVAK